MAAAVWHVYLQWGLNLHDPRILQPPVIRVHAFSTELTWQVLIEGRLTSLLLVH